MKHAPMIPNNTTMTHALVCGPGEQAKVHADHVAEVAREMATNQRIDATVEVRLVGQLWEVEIEVEEDPSLNLADILAEAAHVSDRRFV